MDAVDEELRTLRARAYGPHPDIADDPAAVRRLDELEGLRAAQRAEMMSTAPATPAGAEAAQVDQWMPDELAPGLAALDALFPPTPGPPEHPASAELTPAPEQPEHPVSAEEPTAPQQPAGPRRYRRRTLWIVAATAAALAAGITYAVVSFAPVSASSGAPQISTLAPSNAIEVPMGFIGALEDSPAFEFHGLTLFLGSGGYSAPSAQDSVCLMAVSSDQIPATEDFSADSWSVDGFIYSGCQVGVFPGTIEIPLRADAPAELREAFPDGTALQFVLDGDRVGVFLDSE
jgi:hypothetical protein